MSLCEAGDAIFFEWSREFPCQIDNEGTQQHLHDEIELLEKRLEVWKKELAEFREKFPLTNLYTNKQCLALRKYISPLKESMKYLKDLPAQVFTLLKIIRKDVNEKCVEDAFYKSYLSDANANHEDWRHDQNTMDDNNFILLPKADIKKNLQELMDEYEIDESVAKASFMRIIPFDMGKAIIWCKKQEDGTPRIEDDADLFDEQMEKMYGE